MRQKGFIQIAIIVGVLIITAVAGYLQYSYNKKANSQNHDTSDNSRSLSEVVRDLKDMTGKAEDTSQPDISSKPAPSPTPSPSSTVSSGQLALPSQLTYSNRQGWQALQSPNGYSLDVPVAWNLSIVKTIDGNFTCKDIATSGSIVTLNTTSMSGNYEEIANREKGKLLAGEYSSSKKPRPMLLEQRTTINGLPAVYHVFWTDKPAPDLNPFLWHYLYIQKGNKVIWTYMLVTEPKYQNYRQDIINIFGSFR